MRLPKKNKISTVSIRLLAVLLIVVGLCIFIVTLVQRDAPTPFRPAQSSPPHEHQDKPKQPKKIAIQVPQKLTIDRIGVDAPIHSVGLDQDGAMDVPRNNVEVGWYEKSALMGQTDYSVLLDGHYGTDAQPAVFYKLGELRVGDAIHLTGEKGAKATYEVSEVSTQPLEDVDMKKALYYGKGEETLTIITCEGVYDAARATYADRQVVYAKRVS